MADEKQSKGKSQDESAQTPSGFALASVGEPAENASDEEKSAHADRYLKAKLKARRG